ncbi:MAG: DUF3459 domain-containing protein, partial [Actinomycetota bacterium]|nr:DUF3459 domain-containing protein [Actinomycetota bacterium]
GFVIASFDDGRVGLGDLAAVIGSVEEANGVGDGAVSGSAHPADVAPIGRAVTVATGDILALGIAALGRAARFPALPVELGLPEVEDLPDEVLADPMFRQTAGARRGRDGCRVPLPWSGDRPPYGFSPQHATEPPWLPQPADWADLTVSAQSADPASMLSLYRRALHMRRELPALGDGRLRWLESPPGSLWFERGPGFGCVVNVDADRVELPRQGRLLLASGPLGDGGCLPADTAVWLGG